MNAMASHEGCSCPWPESNRRPALRRRTLCPLSYRGSGFRDGAVADLRPSPSQDQGVTRRRSSYARRDSNPHLRLLEPVPLPVGPRASAGLGPLGGSGGPPGRHCGSLARIRTSIARFRAACPAVGRPGIAAGPQQGTPLKCSPLWSFQETRRNRARGRSRTCFSPVLETGRPSGGSPIKGEAAWDGVLRRPMTRRYTLPRGPREDGMPRITRLPRHKPLRRVHSHVLPPRLISCFHHKDRVSPCNGFIRSAPDGNDYDATEGIGVPLVMCRVARWWRWRASRCGSARGRSPRRPAGRVRRCPTSAWPGRPRTSPA